MNQPEAQAAFERAVALQQQGQIDEAAAIYSEILQTFRTHHHALHLLGVIASQKGNHGLARRLMESSVALEPEDPDVLANLAHVMCCLGQYALALEHSDQSLRLQPNNPICRLTRGRALRFLGRFEDAIASLDPALQAKPDLLEAYLHRGFCKHKLMQLESAVADYDAALQLRPNHAEALNNRGHALFALEQHERAMQSIQQALQLQPDFPEALYHMGLIRQHEKNYQEAYAYYSRAVALNPQYHQALIRLAFVMHKLKFLPQESLAVLDRALQVNPHDADTLSARAGLLSGLRILNQSIDDYDRAIALNPQDPKPYADRAETLLIAKRTEEAIASFKRALELGGDREELTYALASLGQDVIPTTAPTNYVVNLFDWYADRFDNHLQERLKYQTPAQLCQLIKQVEPDAGGKVLDLGCGTGLCGPLLKPVASHLIGVDLSSNMLEMARKRQVYDDLVCSDITQYLLGQCDVFDLVVATDVFIYVGALEAVFAAASPAIRLGGVFAFSCESSDGEELVLRPSRRYAHSVAYIERLAQEHGFVLLQNQASVIREEGGESLHGFLVVLRRI